MRESNYQDESKNIVAEHPLEPHEFDNFLNQNVCYAFPSVLLTSFSIILPASISLGQPGACTKRWGRGCASLAVLALTRTRIQA